MIVELHRCQSPDRVGNDMRNRIGGGRSDVAVRANRLHRSCSRYSDRCNHEIGLPLTHRLFAIIAGLNAPFYFSPPGGVVEEPTADVNLSNPMRGSPSAAFATGS